MLIKPKLEYGCEAYSSACRSTLEKLNSIQNTAVRTALGAFKSSPIVSILAESGIKPVEVYRNIKIINFFLRIMVNQAHPLHNEMRQRMLEIDQANGETILRNCFTDRVIGIIRSNQIQFKYIMRERGLIVPPWTTDIKVCKELSTVRKAQLTTWELKESFHSHVASHVECVKYYTEGSKTEKKE